MQKICPGRKWVLCGLNRIRLIGGPVYTCKSYYEKYGTLEHGIHRLVSKHNEIVDECNRLEKCYNEEKARKNALRDVNALIVKQLRDEIASLKEVFAAAQRTNQPAGEQSDVLVVEAQSDLVNEAEQQPDEADGVQEQSSAKEASASANNDPVKELKDAARATTAEMGAAFTSAQFAVTQAKAAFKMIEECTTKLELAMNNVQRTFLTLPLAQVTKGSGDSAAPESIGSARSFPCFHSTQMSAPSLALPKES